MVKPRKASTPPVPRFSLL